MDTNVIASKLASLSPSSLEKAVALLQRNGIDIGQKRTPRHGEVWINVGNKGGVESDFDGVFAELRVVDNAVPCGWRRLDGTPDSNPKQLPAAGFKSWQFYADNVEAAFKRYASEVVCI